MLRCADLRDRLYDEDCRHALAGRRPIPTDVSLHTDGCADCRRLWTEAADDLATLPDLLLEPVPAAVVAGVRQALAERLDPPPTLDWTEGIAWASVGAVLPLLAASHLPAWVAGLGPLSLAMVGASFAFAASAVRATLREAFG